MMDVLYFELRQVCNSAALIMTKQAYLGSTLLIACGEGIRKGTLSIVCLISPNWKVVSSRINLLMAQIK